MDTERLMTILKPVNPGMEMINKSTLIPKPQMKDEHGSLNKEVLKTEQPDDI